MSVLFKTLERLVQWRLETTAAPYHRNQHAFRSGHCTEHALSHMTDLAEKALHRKHVALAVFLDIQGAFDTLSSEAVERGMQKHGVEEKLTSWYTQYLRHRICKVAGQSGHYLVRHGTGQGGVGTSHASQRHCRPDMGPTALHYAVAIYMRGQTCHHVRGPSLGQKYPNQNCSS